jgi:hypothetical protein
MARKAETLKVLFDAGLIKQGTAIEVMPECVPDGMDSQNPLFQAEVVDPNGRQGAIRWQSDGQLWSLTALTDHLIERYNLKWVSKTCRNWRRTNCQRSLWDEAEAYPRC